ncbi:hypothetical protein L6452_34927 [Arctium lappa]|uniref:Uncharacterized protein n=1 Tax=Arctium lappa TaxID=4217 RepID=A0ACB8YIW3_ARCLA|nr:hypothetical protein L6452_34927 [Arctium lappa]
MCSYLLSCNLLGEYDQPLTILAYCYFCGSYMPLSGFGGALSGLLVGIKQIIPDQELAPLRIKAKGDPSDEFAFSTFFPEFLRPLIDPIASIFHQMLCGRSEASNEARGYTVGTAPLPGSDPVEASRRRERGARALEERLAAERLAAEPQRDVTEKV